jgi:hypothetical protein
VKRITGKFLALAAFSLLAGLVALHPCRLCAQPPGPFPVPTQVQITPDSQRNALNNVRSQAGWLQNSTRTAPNYLTGAYDMVWQQYQLFRTAYQDFKSTLSPRQLANGANDLAELDAGLDILAESFSNYQEDLAAGQANARAFRNMCQVLGRATGFWLQEMNRVSSRLRVGWP